MEDRDVTQANTPAAAGGAPNDPMYIPPTPPPPRVMNFTVAMTDDGHLLLAAGGMYRLDDSYNSSGITVHHSVYDLGDKVEELVHKFRTDRTEWEANRESQS